MVLIPPKKELFNISYLEPMKTEFWMMAHIDCTKLNKIMSSVLCLSSSLYLSLSVQVSVKLEAVRIFCKLLFK